MARSLIGSIMTLFAPKNGVNPHKRYPNEYDNHFYFNKPLCDGIEFVARIERLSKKSTAEMLMTAGFSSYMGQKLTDHIHAQAEARKMGQPFRPNRFARLLRRYAKERGMDISKFI